MSAPWTVLAEALGHPGTKEMWEDLYVKKKKTLEQLSVQLGVSVGSIRKQLKKDGVKIRARGSGRGSTKIDMTEELAAEIQRDGCLAVAKRLDVTYSTVYKALKRRGLSSRGVPPKEEHHEP